MGDFNLFEFIAGTAPPRMGININDKHQDFTGQILRGEKTIETRNTHSLKPYVGQRVGLISTGIGPATLVGYATVGEPTRYETPEHFAEDYSRHRVALVHPMTSPLWVSMDIP